MDFDQIVAKYQAERYQAHLGLLFGNADCIEFSRVLVDGFSDSSSFLDFISLSPLFTASTAIGRGTNTGL